MKYPYISPTITKVEITLDREITATSSIVLPGNSNNEIEDNCIGLGYNEVRINGLV